MEKIVAIIRDGHVLSNLKATHLLPQDQVIAIVSRATPADFNNRSSP